MPKFQIPVIRTGFAHKTIEVEAENQEEAEFKAINEAGDYEFSERDAKYEIDNGSFVDYPALIQRIKNQLIHIEKDELSKAEQKILDIISLATK